MASTVAVLAHRFDTLFARLIEDLRAIKAAEPLSRVALVVPGRALLRWVRRKLGDALGDGAWLGVEVVPLHALASRVTEDLEGGHAGAEVHRLILSTMSRPGWLQRLDQPEGMLYATFRDLADAGFDAGVAEPAAELLSAEPWWRRGRDLLRLYGEWRALCDTHGLGGRTAQVREAVRRLQAGASLGIDHVLWYGIYDLTGVMADLVRVVCRTVGGRFYFPRFDPDATLARGIPETADAYLREVFDSVVAPVASERVVLDEPPRTPALTVIDASGERGELEAAARSISAWAASQPGQVPWSEVAIIARDATPYLSPAREVMRRYRIPLVTGQGVPARTFGPVRGLLAVVAIAQSGLRRDLFLDAVRHAGHDARAAYLDLLGPLDAALRRFGVVGDWTGLLAHLAEDRPLHLPIRPPREADSTQRPPAHPLPQRVTRRLAQHVQAILTALDGWPERTTIDRHLGRWARLVTAVMGHDGGAACEAVAEALEPTPGRVERGAFLAAVERLLAAHEVERPTGEGVRLLDTMSARGMTFSHVVLLGLNRRRWPRNVREDPLIPDRIRRLLRTDLGLDALPVKQRGHAEEALLFRHAAACGLATLTIAYQRSDEDGNAMVPSPFLDPLLALPHRRITVARRRHDVLAPLVAGEHVDQLTEADLAYQVALERREEAGPALCRLSATDERRALVRAGLRALVQRDDLTAEPGAHDGILGASWAGDLRHEELAPTRVEDLIRCPWQMFVRRQLHIEPVEAAGELPVRDPLRVGTVVHRVHERLVAWLHGVEEPDELTWEDARELGEQWASAELDDLLADEPTLAPLARALLMPELLRRVGGLVDLLRARLGQSTPRGAEQKLTGELTLPDGRVVRLQARADRIDTVSAGHEVADIKTGGPIADEDVLLTQLSVGRRLQVPFYHWLGADLDATWAGFEFVPAEGGYHRVGLSRERWRQVEPGLRRVLATAVDVLDGGLFIHRSGRHCDWCDVSATCTRVHYPASRRLQNLDEPAPDRTPEAEVIQRYRHLANRGFDLEGDE